MACHTISRWGVSDGRLDETGDRVLFGRCALGRSLLTYRNVTRPGAVAAGACRAYGPPQSLQ